MGWSEQERKERLLKAIEGTPVEEFAVVHILHHGIPLCRFTTRAPKTWPQGRGWVPLLELEGFKRLPNACSNCLETKPPDFYRP